MTQLELAVTPELGAESAPSSAPGPAPESPATLQRPARLDRRYFAGCVSGLLLGAALALPGAYALLRAGGGPSEPLLGGSRLATLIADGREALAQKNPGRALTLFRAAAQASPDNAKVHNNICVALNDLRRYDEAIGACSVAVELDPGFSLARNNLAWARAQLAKARPARRGGGG